MKEILVEYADDIFLSISSSDPQNDFGLLYGQSGVEIAKQIYSLNRFIEYKPEVYIFFRVCKRLFQHLC
jgi:hypothetical protein